MLDTAEATSTLLRLFLLVFFAGETGVLFLHLLRGVVDTFAFIIGALQLLAIVIALALLDAPGPGERAAAAPAAARVGAARGRVLAACVHAFAACLVVDVAFSARIWIDGGEGSLLQTDDADPLECRKCIGRGSADRSARPLLRQAVMYYL